MIKSIIVVVVVVVVINLGLTCSFRPKKLGVAKDCDPSYLGVAWCRPKFFGSCSLA
jgi:hypothetical protein